MRKGLERGRRGLGYADVGRGYAGARRLSRATDRLS